LLKLWYIGFGGAIGALCRYGLSGVIPRFWGGVFPWGTLGVNLVGCFLIGLLWEFCTRFAIGPALRSFIFIGFLGAFTTFSTFGLESLNLLKAGEVRLAFLNIFLSNGLGLVLVFAGIEAAAVAMKIME